MKSEYESEYISKVKTILENENDPVEVIERLLELSMPSNEDSSFNTLAITNTLEELDIPSFDDFMEDGTRAEETCDESVKLFKQSIKDLEDGNLYAHQYSVELAYSKISGGNYTYKLVQRQIKVNTLKEAIDEKARIRSEAPRNHPEDEEYTIEDDRLKFTILNSKNDVVVYEHTVAIQGQ